MQFKLGLILIAFIIMSNNIIRKQHDHQQPPISLVGTWKLISGTTITKGDTSVVVYTKNQKMIKIINKSHFAFLRHDLKKGKDADSVYESGGGTYTLSGNKYTEYLEYCSAREWEDKKFQFNVTIKKDTLIQQGFEKVEETGVNHEIIEKYIRIKN